MNRVLVTGLPFASRDGCTHSVPCNWDQQWIVQYPCTLLWADRIILTPSILGAIRNDAFPHEYPHIARCIRLVFDRLDAEGLIEVRQPAEVISPEIDQLIESQVTRDFCRLPAAYPDRAGVEESPCAPPMLRLDENRYCQVHIKSMYVALTLARAWGASCLFDDESVQYCDMRYGSPRTGDRCGRESALAFHEVFCGLLPDEPLIAAYAAAEQCLSCKHQADCQDRSMRDTEKAVMQLLEWREYDELHQLRGVVGRIAEMARNAEDRSGAAEMAAQFCEEERRLRKRMRSLFPRARRMVDIATLVSIFTALAGVASGSYPIVAAGSAAGLASQGGKKLLDLLESRYRWVGFVNRQTPSREGARRVRPQPPDG